MNAFYLNRDAYTSVVVSAIVRNDHVMGVALVPNITEDDSLSECASPDSSKYLVASAQTVDS